MPNPFEQHPFIPKSTQIIASGTGRDVSHLILAGIFNSLIVMLSHILYALHSLAGLFIFSYFHQAFENLFLATVYILMVIKIPGRALTINAGVWGFMGPVHGILAASVDCPARRNCCGPVYPGLGGGQLPRDLRRVLLLRHRVSGCQRLPFAFNGRKPDPGPDRPGGPFFCRPH